MLKPIVDGIHQPLGPAPIGIAWNDRQRFDASFAPHPQNRAIEQAALAAGCAFHKGVLQVGQGIGRFAVSKEAAPAHRNGIFLAVENNHNPPHENREGREAEAAAEKAEEEGLPNAVHHHQDGWANKGQYEEHQHDCDEPWRIFKDQLKRGVPGDFHTERIRSGVAGCQKPDAGAGGRPRLLAWAQAAIASSASFAAAIDASASTIS